MAKLPDNADDQVVAEILVKDFGVAVIPGKFQQIFSSLRFNIKAHLPYL